MTITTEQLASIAQSINELYPTAEAKVISAYKAGEWLPIVSWLMPGGVSTLWADGEIVNATGEGSTTSKLRTEPYACIAVAHELLGNLSYKIVDGTFYPANTPDAVIRILEHSRKTKQRIRIHQGDVATGRDWMEEWDVTGHVSRTMGPNKAPILISSARAMGGGIIGASSIVRIRSTIGGADLYRHSAYHAGLVEFADMPLDGMPYKAMIDGKIHAAFATAEKRAKWLKKMGLELTENKAK